MVKIIIYGTGYVALRALEFIGFDRVYSLAQTEIESTVAHNKKVISLKNLIDLYKKDNDITIVIATQNHNLEIKSILENNEIYNSCFFSLADEYNIRQYLPVVGHYGKYHWLSYDTILSRYKIYRYKKIGIYGYNPYIKYLVLEIMIQAPNAKIFLVDIDNDVNVCNKIDFGEIDILDCLLINVKHDEDNIRNTLQDGKGPKLIDLFDNSIDYNYAYLEKYKDMYKGKRCFIVATGPSLSVDDLNKLHTNKEVCISVNKIHRCYSKTEWRADYVGIADEVSVRELIKDINDGKEIPRELFVGDNNINFLKNEIRDEFKFFHLNVNNGVNHNKPQFSSDFSKCAYSGCTITYDFALQFAVYMGFSEIYLLGVDHSFSGGVLEPGDHFIEDYYTEEEVKYRQDNNISSKKNIATLAYEMAAEYARKRGIKIYNATRGGELEVFERVNFDNLFD